MGSLCDAQLLHETKASRTTGESESATTLTFHVINQSAQRNVLLLAPRAMIDSSFMCGASKMLIQA